MSVFFDVLHPYLDWDTFNIENTNHPIHAVKNDREGNIEFIFNSMDLEGTKTRRLWNSF